VREARRAIAEDRSVLVRLSPDPDAEPAQDGVTQVSMTCFSGGTLDVYIEPQQPQPRLIVVGYLPVAQALCHLGKAMNYRVLAIAPADEAASVAHADEVRSEPGELAGWVNALSFVVVATHGNGDEEALREALGSGAPYVGLVASRSRAKTVLESLRAAGVAEHEIARIKVPAGLDIQARQGDEIALSIMAEIVQRRRNLEALAWESAGEPAPDLTRSPSHPPAAREAIPDAAPEPGLAIDPVCGMTVRIATARHTLALNGATHYFCGAGCKARFAADPSAYRPLEKGA
jgi:xanthine dehydrogenase accessory factor